MTDTSSDIEKDASSFYLVSTASRGPELTRSYCPINRYRAPHPQLPSLTVFSVTKKVVVFFCDLEAQNIFSMAILLSDATHSKDDPTSHFYQIILFLLLIPMFYVV